MLKSSFQDIDALFVGSMKFVMEKRRNSKKKMFHIISKYKMFHLFKVPLFLIIIVSVLPSAEAKICYDIDARNDPAEIELRLRNCTIVVGSVSILLIERHRDVFNFTSLQFPELQ